MIAAAYGSNNRNSNMENRSHPNLQTLDALTLSYPGFERDKREAEAVHWGSSDSTLSFDAAIRRLKVKQRAHEEQRSTKAIYRSHPNLVSLDSLELTYPDWEEDIKKAEEVHNNNTNCDFLEILRKIQIKQLRFENDRSHYRLREIDNLKLSYPGWMKDIRSLEKFHFEEAFFLPGDSLFQSKLDGLKRRQQIYLRSQKLRASRLGGQSFSVDQSESEEISTSNTPAKGSYAILVGSQKPNKPKPTALDPEESEPHDIRSASSSSSSSVHVEEQFDEERSDRHSTYSSRTPYAVVIDADAISVHLSPSDSGRTPSDPPNPRPDPPECNKSISSRRTRTSIRDRIDCDGSDGSDAGSSRGGIDCDEQVSVRDQNSNTNEPKSDPVGICEDELCPPDCPSTHYHQHQHQHQTSWPSPSKLSSYIDLEPVQDNTEESDGVTSEDADQVPALPTTLYSPSRSLTSSKSRSSHHSYHRNRAVNRPKGIYSAPQLPVDDDDISSVSRAYSVATPSSSRAVYRDDRSTAFSSQCSTMAVWSEDQSVASASSSRAVWAESPTPYDNPKYSLGGTTPLSIRTAHSMPDTPRQHLIPTSSSRPRGSSRGAVSEHPRTLGAVSEHPRIRAVASEQQPRTRRMRGEKSSRVSRSSRASSSNGTNISGRSKKLGRCTICGDADKNHVFVPCGHLCACKGCAAQVISRQMKCPVCRGGVSEALQVFL